jgi:histidine ammonia-lyase
MPQQTRVLIRPGELALDDIRAMVRQAAAIAVDSRARPVVEAAAGTVRRIVERDKSVYGINTGFGRLARTRIDRDQLDLLQRNLVLSHCTGTGEPLDDAVVRLVLALKVAGLARGYSGVRWELIERLLLFHNESLLPVVPARGSVGASGDLAPLAHVAAALIGVGRVRLRGEAMDALEAHGRLGIEPLVLGPKEGLALLNGTQVSTALALAGLLEAEKLFLSALVTGAMAVDSIKGSDVPFDPRIHQIRGHPGQRTVARIIRGLRAGSAIPASHIDCDRVQDPYSIRCQPQVMGACLDQITAAAACLVREANAVSDNPLVFADRDEVLSGGNFHAEPVAMAADNLALAIAEIGALCERRIALLIDADLSGLPAFLVREGGVNSGFMVAHVTAAALASENKSLAHPASVDSLPTSANQEDHVSMATFAARRLIDMLGNSTGIVAIEWLAAAQAMEFHRPLETSPVLERAIAILRRQVPAWDRDRFFHTDIEAARAGIAGGELAALVDEDVLGER